MNMLDLQVVIPVLLLCESDWPHLFHRAYASAVIFLDLTVVFASQLTKVTKSSSPCVIMIGHNYPCSTPILFDMLQ